ncbi:MAG: FAD-dependent protein [bacterium]|nr:hypothetical protein [bacterium]MBU1917444.1 hypothetical protein [bacterium]
MKEYLNVAIMGAGPAGLFLAQEIIRNQPQAKIAIIDMGKSLKDRKCPLLVKGICAQCRVCHAVHGVGGAGMYSDGKLSLYPAGTGLKDLIGEKEARKLCNDVYWRLIEELQGWPMKITAPDSEKKKQDLSNLKESALDLKTYNVAHVGSEGIQKICRGIEANLRKQGVQFCLGTRVSNVISNENGFEIFTQGVGGDQKFYADNFVSAAGKSSGSVLRRILMSVGLPIKYNHIELGVRVETFQDAIEILTDIHLDAKVKMKHDDAEIRTFCMCRGGYLARCGYDTFDSNKRIFTISGFSLTQSKSQNSNFGILVRRRFPSYVDPIAMQLPIISKINKVAKGTVVQRYEDFLKNKKTSLKRLIENGVSTTLPESAPANLHELMPNNILEPVRVFMENLSKVMPKLGHGDTLLHAPVWEMCWDRIPTNDKLETDIPGFYVAGDAIGIARGIVQAAASGIIVARSILSRMLTHKLHKQYQSRMIFEPNINVEQSMRENLNVTRLLKKRNPDMLREETAI